MKRILKNYPFDLATLAKTPITIIEGEDGWDDAFKQYLSGKNPSSDPAWKEGVYMGLVKET